jgi:hypothetical protein
LEKWRRLRTSAQVRQILREQDDAIWAASAAAYFDSDNEVYNSDGDGDEEQELVPDTPPVELLAMALPVLPEDKDDIPTEAFILFQPVRILKGDHAGIKAYFQEYDTKKKVCVMLSKDPYQSVIVFRSSISAIICSTDGCKTRAIAPPKTYPYDFDTHLCKEHQHEKETEKK